MLSSDQIIPYSASLAFDISAAPENSVCQLAGPLNLSLTNIQPGARGSLLLIAGPAMRSINYPKAWKFEQYYNLSQPTSIPSNRSWRLDFHCIGTTDADVYVRLATRQ